MILLTLLLTLTGVLLFTLNLGRRTELIHKNGQPQMLIKDPVVKPVVFGFDIGCGTQLDWRVENVTTPQGTRTTVIANETTRFQLWPNVLDFAYGVMLEGPNRMVGYCYEADWKSLCVGFDYRVLDRGELRCYVNYKIDGLDK